MNFQLSPESRTFTVDFLAARTEYVFTLKALTKDDLLDTDGTSRCSLTSVSAWTNGVEPAQKLTVHARTPTSLLIGWQPSVPYGISFVKHYQLHYVENRLIRSRSRGKVGEVKDAGKKLWIESNRCEAEMEQLEPGTVYRVVVETVAGVADYSYEDDFEGEAVESASTVSSEPSFKTPEADILCLSEPLLVCTAAPPESPVLLVSGFTPTQIHLSWNKPLLVRPGKTTVNVGTKLSGCCYDVVPNYGYFFSKLLLASSQAVVCLSFAILDRWKIWDEWQSDGVEERPIALSLVPDLQDVYTNSRLDLPGLATYVVRPETTSNLAILGLLVQMKIVTSDRCRLRNAYQILFVL